MVKQAVKVVIRSRPTSNFASKNINIDPSTGNISVTVPKLEEKGIINNQQESWKFKFDKLMHNASQEDVFEYCARDIVASVAEGYNGTVLCYGQTGAGKTFTMSGSTQNYKYRGLIPRAISQVFQDLGSKFDQAVTVRVSYVEIYNELMFDLLSPLPTHEQSGNISIQEDPKGGIHVKGLSHNVCANEEEALNFLFEGETNRTISEHHLNKNSSRSHCIFSIHVESKSRVESSEKVVSSKLHLVDLAGSERTKKTGSEGITLKEAAFINKSLSFLEQVVVAVCDRHRDHVPYRQSKLTNMLKDSIGGNCKTLMVANVWPEPSHLEETTSTLKFATRMMRVANEAVVNVHADPTLLLKRYEREIRDLKQELAMHDTLANRGRINYDPYSAEQQYEIQLVAQKFMEGELEEVEEINSLRQVRELFHQMRLLYKKMEQNVRALSSRHDERRSAHEDENAAEATKKKTMAKREGVGEEEEGKGGFGLGVAPRESKPQHKIDMTRSMNREEGEEEEGAEGAAEEEEEEKEGEPRKKAEKREFKSRQEAFMEYKKEVDQGRETEGQIVDNRTDLRNKKGEVKKLTEICNKSKKEMDRLKELLNAKSEEKQKTMHELEGEEEVIDEEEYAFIKQMKDLKKQYRESFEQLKSLKGDVFLIQQNIDLLKQTLVANFELWYDQTFEKEDVEEAPVATTFAGATQDERVMAEVDPDALAYIRAKKKVDTLHKAKKMEKTRKIR